MKVISPKCNLADSGNI